MYSFPDIRLDKIFEVNDMDNCAIQNFMNTLYYCVVHMWKIFSYSAIKANNAESFRGT